MEFKIKKLGNNLPEETPQNNSNQSSGSTSQSAPRLSLRDKMEQAPAPPAKESPTRLSLKDKSLASSNLSNSSMPCPGCGAEIDSEAVICVQCGTNVQSGKQMKTKAKKRKVISGKKKGSFLIAIIPLVIVLFVLAKMGYLQKWLKAAGAAATKESKALDECKSSMEVIFNMDVKEAYDKEKKISRYVRGNCPSSGRSFDFIYYDDHQKMLKSKQLVLYCGKHKVGICGDGHFEEMESAEVDKLKSAAKKEEARVEAELKKKKEAALAAEKTEPVYGLMEFRVKRQNKKTYKVPLVFKHNDKTISEEVTLYDAFRHENAGFVLAVEIKGVKGLLRVKRIDKSSPKKSTDLVEWYVKASLSNMIE